MAVKIAFECSKAVFLQLFYSLYKRKFNATVA